MSDLRVPGTKRLTRLSHNAALLAHKVRLGQIGRLAWTVARELDEVFNAKAVVATGPAATRPKTCMALAHKCAARASSTLGTFIATRCLRAFQQNSSRLPSSSSGAGSRPSARRSTSNVSGLVKKDGPNPAPKVSSRWQSHFSLA